MVVPRPVAALNRNPAGVGCGVGGCRQVWAAENADDDPASVDERQGNRVLIAAQETLGAVDRVEDPVAFTFAGVVTAVECLDHCLRRDPGDVAPYLLEDPLGHLG